MSTYYYQGICPYTGQLLKLPRTPLVEKIARDLMAELEQNRPPQSEGKMYGVLLAETPTGQPQILKAFSGLLDGKSTITGWVPPIPGRDRIATIEAETLVELERIKQELIALDRLPERAEYQKLASEFTTQLTALEQQHRERKASRNRRRETAHQHLGGQDLENFLTALQHQSQFDGIERRNFKRDRDAKLKPLKTIIDRADQQILHLKQQRKHLSRYLQTEMHTAYRLMNFLGTSATLRDLIPGGIPTGTGDCCAPKLLHYAANHHLKPLAMAEFWWGAPQGDKVPGEFYPACIDRCQPLMGFLLSGTTHREEPHLDSLSPHSPLPPIIYQDDYLIAINKPPGLLSVPGRYFERQDSALTQLQTLYPGQIIPVHRLDQDTSGILLFARDRDTYRHLSQQFEQRQVHKIYEAWLGGIITIERGEISLPLLGNPHDRPRQVVNRECGKPSVTKFWVVEHRDHLTRIEFIPLTGRTHQLRVHAADRQGLGVPILGDRLYGCPLSAERLHLHARELKFQHPRSLAFIHLQIPTPF